MPGTALKPDYRRKRTSRVASGHRPRKGGSFTSTGGADRPRLTTTLPLDALEQLDTLAEQHQLQRNEVLTLALATLAHPEHGHPQAAKRFRELAAAWEGFSQGVLPPRSRASLAPNSKANRMPDTARRRIHAMADLGDAAPKGWVQTLARELGCKPEAVRSAAYRHRQKQTPRTV